MLVIPNRYITFKTIASGLRAATRLKPRINLSSTLAWTSRLTEHRENSSADVTTMVTTRQRAASSIEASPPLQLTGHAKPPPSNRAVVRIPIKPSLANRSAKRKAPHLSFDDEPHAKRPSRDGLSVQHDQAPSPADALNSVATTTLSVFVFGGNSGAELGLGDTQTSAPVKRPRLNPNLLSSDKSIVAVAPGGMHCLALTRTGQVLSWGVNDLGALGRDTAWSGGLRDMSTGSDDESDDEHEGEKLNPHESHPSLVPFPTTTAIAALAASDNASFAVTVTGQVYAWGTFRDAEGHAHFSPSVAAQSSPQLVPRLDPITSVATGEDHVLAISAAGEVWTWGDNAGSQLGHRIQEKRALLYRVPWKLKSLKDITSVGTGAKHSFAVDKAGKVYAWGQNNYGQTGVFEEKTVGEFGAAVPHPTYVEALREFEPIRMVVGGNSHSMAITAAGRVVTWGRLDGFATGHDFETLSEEEIIRSPEGRQAPRILKKPKVLPELDGVVDVASGAEHCLAVTAEGKVWSWGFGTDYRTGLGNEDDARVPTLVENSAIRGTKVRWAGAGGQYSLLAAVA